MKNVLILAYQEGCCGLDFIGRVNSFYASAAMALDVNACVEGIFTAGAADGVYVCDVAGRAKENFFSTLDKRAKIVKSSELGEALNTKAVNSAMIVGAHAKSGTLDAFLDYTWNPVAWHRYFLNDKELGDIGIMSALLGSFSVPVTLVSGDDAACSEVDGLIPGVTTVSVKSAARRNAAVCENVDAARLRLAGKAKTATGGIFAAQPPYIIRIEYNRTDFCDDCVKYNLDKVGRIDAFTVEKRLDGINGFSDLIF